MFTVGQRFDYGFYSAELTHVHSSCIKYKSWLPANFDVILKTMCRMFIYDTIPKQTIGRKGKELSPEEKRVVINIFERRTYKLKLADC